MRFAGVIVILLTLTNMPLAQAQDGRPTSGQNNLWFLYNDSDTVFIFVHGILSDSRDAWFFVGDENNQPTYWPNLVGTPSFDNPSIFLGGFYTEALSGDYTIRDAAEELYSHLSVSKPPASTPVLAKKNIVFIAHSLGGIAVRHMLTKRKEAFQGKFVGLVLVASPSLGAQDAERLNFVLDLVNSEMGKELKWKDPRLVELDKDFRNLVGIEVIENHFYTKYLFLFDRKVVVDEESGGRYFGAPIRIGGSDHSTIAKPKNENDQMHVVLRRFYEQKFKPLVIDNSNTEERNPVLVCRLKSIKSMGWKSGDKTRFCIANGYPQGNFNQGDYKNGGICMAGSEPNICMSYVKNSMPNDIECRPVGGEVQCFR